jgi:hypothetical protein
MKPSQSFQRSATGGGMKPLQSFQRSATGGGMKPLQSFQSTQEPSAPPTAGRLSLRAVGANWPFHRGLGRPQCATHGRVGMPNG